MEAKRKSKEGSTVAEATHHAVLISATARPRGSEEDALECSGSGFVLGPPSSPANKELIVTSASWLKDVIVLKFDERLQNHPSPVHAAESKPRLAWRHRADLQSVDFEAIFFAAEERKAETHTGGIRLENVKFGDQGCDGVLGRCPVSLVGVYLMEGVYQSLSSHLLPNMEGWTTSRGEMMREAGSSDGGGEEQGDTRGAGGRGRPRVRNRVDSRLDPEVLVDGRLSSKSAYVGGGGGCRDDDLLSSLVLPLSCVAVLECGVHSYSGVVSSRSLLPVCDSPLLVGDKVWTVGTPFGSFCPEVFLNSLASAHVSRSPAPAPGSRGAGLRGAGLLDGRSLPGCEGAMVLDGKGSGAPSSTALVGMVIAPLSTPRGSMAGLSLFCGVGAVMDAIAEECPAVLHSRTRGLVRHSALLKATNLSPWLPHVVAVETLDGSSWGSGILVSSDLVLTCGHVVQHRKGGRCLVKALSDGVAKVLAAHTLYTSGPRAVPDIAILEIENHSFTSFQATTKWRLSASRSDLLGLPVSVTGFGLKTSKRQPQARYPLCSKNQSQAQTDHDRQDGEGEGESVPLSTHGVVCGVSWWEGRPVLLQTTAAVLPGMSGGLVTGHYHYGDVPLAMVISNSEDLDTGSLHTNVNYCLPLAWVAPYVTEFNRSRDVMCFKALEREGGERQVVSLWELRCTLYHPSQHLGHTTSKL